MSILSEAALIEACRTLFGDDLQLTRDFLWYLQPNGVKAAYRQKAKEAHPDLFVDSAPQVKKNQTAFFQEVNRAYDMLRTFFDEREKGRRPLSGPSPHRQETKKRNSHNPGRRKSSYRIPERPLEFGHYLYHRGLVSYQQLIDALVWQRRQRPCIGELALNFGWLRRNDLDRIFSHKGSYARFGDRAIHLGLLSSGQVNVLLTHQRTLHKRIGQYFVEKKILAGNEVEHLVKKLTEHNARIHSHKHQRKRYRAR